MGWNFPFIFSFIAFLMFLLMILFPLIISLRFLVCLKGIIGSSTNILAFFLYLQNRPAFFHDSGDSWDGSVVRSCQRYNIDIVVILGFCCDVTCLFNFSFISSALYPHSTFFLSLVDWSSEAVTVEHRRFSLNARLTGILFLRQSGCLALLCK